MHEVDVLILGAGPTGTTLALELAAHNISFRVIDKAPKRSDKSRAFAVQPRTLELLNRHGNVHDLVSKGKMPEGFTVFVNQKKAVEIEVADIPGSWNTAYPRQLFVSQRETEQFLDSILARYGRAVEWDLEAKSVEQDDEGVTTRVSTMDGAEETIRSRYVIGADGAHSVVRHAAKNLTFDGGAYPQEFILADTHVKWELVNERFYLCLARGLVAIFPLGRGLIRVVVSRPDVKDSDEMPQLSDIQGFFNQAVPGGGELYDPEWITRFHLHHRGVNSYRDGRLFVAGDAAHVHSPAGGQGMNTGIQDAINLGWKLAAVLDGSEPEEFLDTYNLERRPIGQKLLHLTDRAFEYLTSTNRLFLFFRNLILPWVMPWVARDPRRRAKTFRFVSGFGITYRKSPIVRTAAGFKGPIQGGYRVIDGKIRNDEGESCLLELLTAGSFHLVLFSGINTTPASEKEMQIAAAKVSSQKRINIKIHLIFGEAQQGILNYEDVDGTLHREFGFMEAGYVLARPDGYVAHIGFLRTIDAVVEWLK